MTITIFSYVSDRILVCQFLLGHTFNAEENVGGPEVNEPLIFPSLGLILTDWLCISSDCTPFDGDNCPSGFTHPMSALLGNLL